MYSKSGKRVKEDHLMFRVCVKKLSSIGSLVRNGIFIRRDGK